jgi:hypothetical protein
VSGTVTVVRSEEDGDVHFDLALDSPYTGLVNNYNVLEQHGGLVAEIVPADEPGCTPGQAPRPASGSYDYGTCTGANVQTPSVGQHVTIIGPYVVDTNHGWTEIHPVWGIAQSGPAAAATPPPPPQPGLPSPALSPARANRGGPVVHPGAFCSPAGATGVTSAGTPMVCKTSPTDSRLRWRRA